MSLCSGCKFHIITAPSNFAHGSQIDWELPKVIICVCTQTDGRRFKFRCYRRSACDLARVPVSFGAGLKGHITGKMNPQCASCKKTVYPMEKLNCLDKFWHKGCFRCQVCGMTLNMKNYKGYNKLPYCSAHYPTTSFTAVADTPENKRLSDNTKKQSLLQYHAEFEKSKGTYQAVADDLETKRASKSAQIASDLAYKNMLSQREAQEQRRPDQVIEDERRNPRHRVVGRISDYDPAENQPSPYSARSQMPTIYDSNKGGRVEEPAGPRRVGKISDYDPEQNQWGSIGQGYEERVPGRFEPTNQYNPKPASAPGGPNMAVQPPPPQPAMPPPPPAASKISYRALYDYNAADEDEVSFVEGDIVIDATIIDDGWMEGRIKRTNVYGMLPSNYVEKV